MMRRIEPNALPSLRRAAVSSATLARAAEIVEEVRRDPSAVRRLAEKFGEVVGDAPLLLDRDAMRAAYDRLPEDQRALLMRVGERIRDFADAQRRALTIVRVPLVGGEAGLRYEPVDRAGCYAPGGRFPLPSSVLMTAITARAAGVREVVVASPGANDVTLAAAWVAGADSVFVAGGAHAIAALAYGMDDLAPCDVVVGPGSEWVTAAKKIVSGDVGIDMLAGPSELVVYASEGASLPLVAADLLAQAEHDPLALPIAVLDGLSPDALRDELAKQLAGLPTADIARQSLEQGFIVPVDGADQAVQVCDVLAPEHLALHGDRAERCAGRLRHYGALFVGEQAAEVLGDYGAGPNHTLPTGGTAKSAGALSVMSFLRVQTWLNFEEKDPELVDDAVELARLEGLEAHARAAAMRR